MKFKITNNQRKRLIENIDKSESIHYGNKSELFNDSKKLEFMKNYLKKINNNPNYDWIQRTDVEVNEYQFGDETSDYKKVNSYILYSNTDNPPPYKLRLEIYDKILDMHILLYPHENDEPTRGQEILVVNTKNQRINLPGWVLE